MIEVFKELNEDVKTVEKLSYYSKDINYYLSEFRILQEKDIIDRTTSFESSKWLVKTGEFKNNIVFSMSELEYANILRKGKIKLSYTAFQNSLKFFSILLLNSTVAISCGSVINTINKLMLTTNGLSDEFINKIDKDKYFKTDGYIKEFNKVIKYLDYMVLDIDDLYIEKLEECIEKLNSKRKQKLNQRRLPEFKTMFIVDDYITHFIENCDDIDFEKFFPVIFWWKLSTIIPIRTRELILTLNNGLEYKNNKYMLTISRSKLKGSRKYKRIEGGSFEDCYYTQEIAITEELALIIERYKKLLGEIDKDRKFLLSKQTVIKFAKNSTGLKNDFNDNIYSYVNFRHNLILFQEEILKGRYNLRFKNDSSNDGSSDDLVDYISAMDTRHFAIINMVLMGYEPTTISELSGHGDVESSYHYYSHVKEFTNCYIISTAKKKAFNNSERYNGILNIEDDILNNKNISNRLKKLYLMDNKYKEVDGGYCIYRKNDIEPCISVDGNHKRCSYFIPSISSSEEFSKELLKIDDEISSEIKTLQNLVKNHKTIIGFSEKYATALRKIVSSAENKSEILKNYIISEI